MATHSISQVVAPGLPSSPRRLWHVVKYLRATLVRDRAELDCALARAPPYIVVEGTEALRAYAASLAYRGGQEAAWLESKAATSEGTPAYVAVPPLGRIRDGYRRHAVSEAGRPAGSRRRWPKLEPGMAAVLSACVGLLAAVAVEWLAWPAANHELVRGPHHVAAPALGGVNVPLPTHAPLPPPLSAGQLLVQVAVPVLGVLAAAALLVLLVLAIGPGRKRRVSWRVDYRVQGLLIIARVRTQVV